MTPIRGLSPPDPAAQRPSRLAGGTALFLVLVAALAARPLTSETFTDTELSFLSGIEGIAGGPHATATAALDALLLVLSAIAFLIPLPARRSNRVFGVALTALLAAIAVSSWAASDKRAALLAGGNLGATLIAAAALHRLLRAPWMARLALAAVLATGATSAVKCIFQVTGEFADAREFWEEEQRTQLEKAGYDLSDPTVVNYERRLRSGEAMGFQSLSNLAASCLMMCVFPVLGLLCASFRRVVAGAPRPPPTDLWTLRVVLLALAGLLLVAMGFTGSMGAVVATAAGAALFLVFGFAAPTIGRYALLVTICGGALYFGALAATGMYGAAKGTLPHPSLAFRWHYWSTTPAVLHDAGVTGLGRENFQAAYLRHKPPESPEETRDPHNLWLSLLLEMGPLGLAAGVALLGWVCSRALRALAPPAPARDETSNALGGEDANPTLPFAAGLGIAFLVLHGCLSGAFFSPPIFLFWLVQVAAVWLAALAVLCGLLRPVSFGPLDSRWLAAGLAAALLAALVHALVDFALLTPAGLALFAVLAALAVRQYGPSSNAAAAAAPARPLRAAALLPAAFMVAIGLHMGFVVIPAIAAENARDALRARFMQARSLEEAEAAVTRGAGQLTRDRLGDTLPRALVSAARHLARTPELPVARQLHWLRKASEWADEALRRNPLALGPRQDQAAIHTAIAELLAGQQSEADEAAALLAAAEWAERAVEAYPTNPRLRIAAGVAWYEAWRLSRDPVHARRAIAHLTAAREIDDRRPPEEVVRLREAERARITDHLNWLNAGLHPASSRAASED